MTAEEKLKASLIEYILNYEYAERCDVMKLLAIMELIDHSTEAREKN